MDNESLESHRRRHVKHRLRRRVLIDVGDGISAAVCTRGDLTAEDVAALGALADAAFLVDARQRFVRALRRRVAERADGIAVQVAREIAEVARRGRARRWP